MYQVAIHETGHALGLPDYYDGKSRASGDTVGPDGGVGTFDIMSHDRGDHNCFGKLLLGWLQPIVVNWGEDKTVTLLPSAVSRDALIVFPRAAGGSIYSELLSSSCAMVARAGGSSLRASRMSSSAGWSRAVILRRGPPTWPDRAARLKVDHGEALGQAGDRGETDVDGERESVPRLGASACGRRPRRGGLPHP